jgi:putative oxidoreductase
MMNRYSSYSPLVLRLITGIGFMAHGWAKLSRGTAGFERMLLQLGVPFPHIMGNVVPYIELLGGVALLVGLWVRIISPLLMVTMLVAMFTIHIHYGFSSIKTIGLNAGGPVFGPPGYEINLLYVAILLSLMITGAGRFSVDPMPRSRRNKMKV